ncbi:MAG TPA: hypothetical protein EYO31_07595, partial [Phycisphaerales bacterium]|nr:hypothetical protein [Phycisphaerales bacterium]
PMFNSTEVFGLSGVGPITMMAWVNLSSTSEEGCVAYVGDISNYGAGHSSNGWSMGVGAGSYDIPGNHLIGALNGLTVSQFDSGVDIGTGWHHIAIVIISATRSFLGTTSQDIRFYIDGRLVAIQHSAEPAISLLVQPQPSSGELTPNAIIGSDGNNHFTGDAIDRVAFYPHALTGTQIFDIYSMTSLSIDPTPVQGVASGFGTFATSPPFEPTQIVGVSADISDEGNIAIVGLPKLEVTAPVAINSTQLEDLGTPGIKSLLRLGNYWIERFLVERVRPTGLTARLLRGMGESIVISPDEKFCACDLSLSVVTNLAGFFPFRDTVSVFPLDQDRHAGSIASLGGIFPGSLYDSSPLAEIGADFIVPFDQDFVTTDVNGASLGSYINFGFSIDMSNDILVVGAPHDSVITSGDTRGAVYIYKKVNGVWNNSESHMQRITKEDVVSGANFGYSVAISSDGLNILVGVPRVDDNLETRWTGIVYVYGLNEKLQSWSLIDSISANDSFEYGSFGSSL